MGDINAKQLHDAFLAAANCLNSNKELVNELNVFPVPDGDTGTNMTMTIMSAASAVAEIKEPTIEDVARAMASGSLRGARGNSGVILSQLIRGFTKEIRDESSIDCVVMARAFDRAVETAYKAVMKPKEGTILTVAKSMSEKCAELSVSMEDPVELLEEVIHCGDETLQKTPEMLPVLKEAGVVDSGGQGLMFVLKGALAYLKGEEVDLTVSGGAMPVTENAGPRKSRGEISTADIKFGYCTEFMINGDHEFSDEEVDGLRDWLNGVGDSIVCFSDDNIIKVHVHTNHPGNAFEKGLSMGYLSRMKVDNMRLEHHEVLIEDASRIAAEQKAKQVKDAPKTDFVKEVEPQKEFGFIAVCSGDGLENIFRSVGADYVISGGQTMNPSTEDFLRAVDYVNARHIFILPNNKNIIMAAKQTVFLVKDRDLHVISSKTIPQGLSAMISFNPDLSAEDNEREMTEALNSVKSAEVTYAVRDTSIEGHEIHKDDIMVLGDAGLLSVAKNTDEAVLDAMKLLVDEDTEIVTLYSGESVSEEDSSRLLEKVQAAFPNVEFELEKGGQPVYYYFISVE